MTRLISKSLVVLSLLVCVVTIVLWVRSYWRIDSLMLFRVKHEVTTVWIDHHTPMTLRSGPVYETDSHRGSLRLLFLYDGGGCYERGQYPAFWSCGETLLSSWPPHMAMASDGVIEPWLPAATHWPGVAMESRPVPIFLLNGPARSPADPPPPPPIGYTVHALYTPWALWTLLTATLPAGALWRWRRRSSRARRGLCIVCGYDVRASAGRCPECATPIN